VLDSLSSSDDDDDYLDGEGDVAPGSVDAPQMLPRPAAARSGSGLYRALCKLFSSAGSEDFGYEGKEEELRRPEGMKHWGGGR
jgi:hypothetical protein